MNRVRWGIFLCVGLASLAAVAGCGSTRSPFLPPAPEPAVGRKVSLTLLDAATMRPVTQPAQVAVRDAAGRPATVTKDSTGASLNQLTVTNGVFGFAVDDAAALPVRFTVTVDAAGYMPSGAAVTYQGGEQVEVVALVSATAPPAGAVAKVAAVGAADANGVLAAGATLPTPAEPHTAGVTTLTIQPGTRLTTAAGAPLTGPLTATVAYLDNVDPSALETVPGGFTVPVTLLGGGTDEATLVDGGVATIEITDAAGNRAALLDKPITVRATIAATTLNPVTGALVSAGDLLDLFSYSAGAATWKEEGPVPVTIGASGLEAVAQVSHLSWFRFAFPYWWYTLRAPPAPQPPACRVANVFVDGAAGNPPVLVSVARVGGGFYAVAAGAGQVPVSFPSVIGQADVTVTYNGRNVGSARVTNGCEHGTSGDVHVPVTMPNTAPATIDVYVAAFCQQDPSVRTVLGGATVAVYRPGQRPFLASTDGSGHAQFARLEGGYTYGVSVTSLEGETALVPKIVNPGGNRVDVTISKVCQVVGPTGATGGAGR